MLQKFTVAVACLVVCAGLSLAEEIKGKVKSVDADKGTLTLTVGDKDQTIAVAKDADVFSLGKAKKGQPAPKQAVSGGLGGLTAGAEVTVTTEKKDAKDTATAIKLETPAKKKKDKQ